MIRCLTAIVEHEDDGYFALCPALDVASQGATVAQARENLIEAVTLFLETAFIGETDKSLTEEVYITHIEVAVG